MDQINQITRLNELDKLAKLLAVENILVEHKNVPTAFFDTQSRVLTLPMWKNISKSLYHMLIEHEIGHALYTPTKEWHETIKQNTNIRDVLNVIEDARIERLIKEKYPGTRRDFREGYKELFDNDFFQVKNKKIINYSLLDRLNLYYKLGDHIKIPFTAKEKLIADEIDKVMTFGEVIALAKRLVKLIKTSPNSTLDDHLEIDPNIETVNSITISTEDLTEDVDITQSEIEPNKIVPTNKVETNDESNSSENVKEESSEKDNFENSDQSPIVESETAKALENMMKNIIDSTARPNIYYRVEMIKNFRKYVIDYQTVLSDIRKYQELSDGIIAFNKLRNSSNRVVDYILKEFQIRKAADQYVRSRESKTGVINPTRLYAYKMTNDIFRRVTISPDSKNHSIVMFVDFSGSMYKNMKSTIDQLINLVLFCRKANIPHRVYAFSDAVRRDKSLFDNEEEIFQKEDIRAKYSYPNTLVPDGGLTIIELYHDSMKLNDFRDMSAGLIAAFEPNERLAADTPRGADRPAAPPPTSIYYCKYFRLGSTPLDGTILIARSLLKEFKKQTNTQIVSAIFLTDGDSSGVFTNNSHRRPGIYGRHEVIYDSVSRKYFLNIPTNSKFVTNTLLKIIKSDGYHVIGFRIDSKYKIKSTIKWENPNYSLIAEKELSKNGCVTLFDFRGYDELHMIYNLSVNNHEDEDGEFSFEINENATKNQIKKAFIQAHSDRINSRIILANFAKKIAA